jgi:hypothetical protein
MGFTYDSMEEENYDDSDFQKKVLNFSLRQLKQRNWLRRKAQQMQEQGDNF